MFMCYQETSRSVPTLKELPGTLDFLKSRVAAFIGIKLNEGCISVLESGVYAEIYSDDGIKLTELHRIGNSSWDWVDCNTSFPDDPCDLPFNVV